MSIQHPPLVIGVAVLLALSGIFVVGATGEESPSRKIVNDEQTYSENVFGQVRALEGYGEELPAWCAEEFSKNKKVIESFAQNSVNPRLWTEYSGALENCATGDDLRRSRAFLVESIYALAAAHK